MKRPWIVVSGVHSGPDPSPGIGIAQSLREAFPDASITAVDYSVQSSGLHHPVFDHVLLQPSWAEIDLETYASQILEHLEKPTSCWISGLDVEIEWLATAIRGHPRLLVPNLEAQQRVRKPLLDVARHLRMQVPEFLPAVAPATDLHALGRYSGWRLWVKGKYHDAYAARSFSELRQQIKAMENHWPLEDIFVQQHVSGLERSITFAAYGGDLIDAVVVEKRSVTSQGKTWAAAVTAAPADMRERLATLLAEIRWTGGGEVEFILDERGREWLIDFNPRFPAYIYGVTLCGHNLPAYLVSTALGLEFSRQPPRSWQFIRVVQEIPVRQELPLPRMVLDDENFASPGKHPSSQPALVRRFRKSKHPSQPIPERSPPPLPTFLDNWSSPPRTPYRFREFSAAEALIDQLARTLQECSPKPRIIPAMSVKTDPHQELARAFLNRGWWAEVISPQELEWAHKMGFKPSQIVFNGPKAVDLASFGRRRVAVVFADSVEAFEALLESQPCEVIGLRLRTAAVSSRFGIDLTDFRAFNRVLRCLSRRKAGLRLGLHIHFASDLCGPRRWNDLVEHALVWGQALAEASGAEFSVFDIGGGWHTHDFLHLLIPSLPDLQSRITRAIPSVDTIILEPGKAVASGTAWLVTRVIEVRSRGSDSVGEVVVDASIADLPLAGHYGRRIVQLRNGRCLGWLTVGSKRILGSICMETDILAEGVEFPEAPAIGDELLFSLAGGYDASMAWNFASGVSRDS